MTKKCIKCLEVKPLNLFHKKGIKTQGYCKKCNNSYMKDYNKNRRKKDISYKLLYNLRVRLRTALKLQFKKGKTLNSLGCSIKDLKMHLEQQFLEGMTWNNYGNKKGC